MQTDHWTIWHPQIPIHRKYDVIGLIENPDRLQILLSSIEDVSQITVQFPGFVYAYRSTVELAALETINQIKATEGKQTYTASDWTFFIVENSSYAKQIERASQGIYPASALIHFVIVAGTCLIEVLTSLMPEIVSGWNEQAQKIETMYSL